MGLNRDEIIGDTRESDAPPLHPVHPVLPMQPTQRIHPKHPHTHTIQPSPPIATPIPPAPLSAHLQLPFARLRVLGEYLEDDGGAIQHLNQTAGREGGWCA